MCVFGLVLPYVVFFLHFPAATYQLCLDSAPELTAAPPCYPNWSVR